MNSTNLNKVDSAHRLRRYEISVQQFLANRMGYVSEKYCHWQNCGLHNWTPVKSLGYQHFSFGSWVCKDILIGFLFTWEMSLVRCLRARLFACDCFDSVTDASITDCDQFSCHILWTMWHWNSSLLPTSLSVIWIRQVCELTRCYFMPGLEVCWWWYT